MDAQIDLVIFDFDGTLADSTAWAIRAVRPLAERFKFKAVTEDEIAMLRGRTSREIIDYLACRCGRCRWSPPTARR
jgi:phosphoglycolate phosphatase